MGRLIVEKKASALDRSAELDYHVVKIELPRKSIALRIGSDSHA